MGHGTFFRLERETPRGNVLLPNGKHHSHGEVTPYPEQDFIMTRNPWNEHPSWSIVDKALRREWQLACGVLWAATMVAVGISVMLGSWWIVAGVVLILAALACLYYLHGSGHYRRSGLWRRLRERPETFTWVYAVAFQRIPFGFFLSEQYRITLACADGQRYDLRVRSAEYRAVMLLLERTLTRAVFGWSKERQQAWERNPGAMLRDQGSDAR
jgi:hypothetical protein